MSQLALPYPVDEETCSAQFNKHNHSLTIVLPVLPHFASTCDSMESVPDMKDTKEDEALPAAKVENVELLNSVSLETLTEICPPVRDDTSTRADSSHDSVSSQVRSDWSVRDTWTCPPFSYEQSEDHVTIVLHVPHVKKASVTSLLEKNSVRDTSWQ